MRSPLQPLMQGLRVHLSLHLMHEFVPTNLKQNPALFSAKLRKATHFFLAETLFSDMGFNAEGKCFFEAL